MGSLQIESAVIRSEAVSDLSKPPHSVRETSGRPAHVRPPCRQLAENMAESPTEFCGPRLLRPAKGHEKEVAIFPVINPICAHDLRREEGAVQVDNQGSTTQGVRRQSLHPLQIESRIFPSEEDALHFDLDPR